MSGVGVTPLPPPSRPAPPERNPRPPSAGVSPPPSATVRGHRAPPGPHACGTGKRHVPTYALAHGRRLAGGRRADLRDPSHGGGTASDARPGRGVGLASFLGGALGIPGGVGGSFCYGAGTSSPTRAPCAWHWQTSRPYVCTGTRSPTSGRTSC